MKALLFLAGGLFALAGCHWPRQAEAPKPVAQRITWCGRSVAFASESALADTGAPGACVRIHRLEFPGAGSPFRLELREYRSPLWSFAAWQVLANGGHAQEGCARIGPRWVFVHGPYLGITDSSAATLYPEEFQERIAFAGEPSFSLPSQFEAFPLLGRIPGSERIVFRDFLGGPWRGPLYSIAYHCHGDTALAFRGLSQDVDSVQGFLALWTGTPVVSGKGRPWRFEGRDEFGQPVLVEDSPKGIWGFSGCFDSVLASEYAEKMQKMQPLWHKP